jgi:hypothetical protein
MDERLESFPGAELEDVLVAEQRESTPRRFVRSR